MARRTDPTTALTNALMAIAEALPSGVKVYNLDFDKDAGGRHSIRLTVDVDDEAALPDVLRDALIARLEVDDPRYDRAEVETALSTLAGSVTVCYRLRRDYTGPVYWLETSEFKLDERFRGVYTRWGSPTYRSFDQGERCFTRDRATAEAFIAAAEAAGGEAVITSVDNGAEEAA
jgi:hypothetical protein